MLFELCLIWYISDELSQIDTFVSNTFVFIKNIFPTKTDTKLSHSRPLYLGQCTAKQFHFVTVTVHMERVCLVLFIGRYDGEKLTWLSRLIMIQSITSGYNVVVYFILYLALSKIRNIIRLNWRQRYRLASKSHRHKWRHTYKRKRAWESHIYMIDVTYIRGHQRLLWIRCHRHRTLDVLVVIEIIKYDMLFVFVLY